MAAAMTAAQSVLAEPRVESSAKQTIFIRLFGVAMVAHVVGNWFQPDLPSLVGWLNLGVGLAGALLIVRPETGLLLAGSAFTIGSVLAEMPVTGNHWLVAGLVAAAILVSNGNPERYLPAARWILIVFYSFAAFAKLNSAFFDPSVSCAVFYSNQWLNSWGLPSLGPALSRTAIWGTVLMELSVPLLLTIKRFRFLGVLVGTVFHTVISYDLSQHFYDFTAVLLPLFFAFVPGTTAERLEGNRRRSVGTGRMGPAIWLGVAGILVTASALPENSVTRPLLLMVPFLLWIPFSILLLVGLVNAAQPGQSLNWRLNPALSLVVLVALLNGLTPYTEVKTGYGFNMYANLVTAGGESNHLLVSRTIPLRDGYHDPVRIFESTDDGLELYRDLGYLIAYPQLQRYLSTRRDVGFIYERGAAAHTVQRAGDVAELVEPGPWWWRFFPLRSLDARTPPRCQDVFLPAL